MQLAQLACNRLTLCVHRPTSSTAAFSPQYFQQQSISSYFSLPTQLVTVCLFLQAKDQMICEFTFYCLNFVSSSQLRFRRRPKQSRLRRPVCTAPHLFSTCCSVFLTNWHIIRGSSRACHFACHYHHTPGSHQASLANQNIPGCSGDLWPAPHLFLPASHPHRHVVTPERRT